MHRTQGLPSPSSTCAARTVCPSASRQRPPTPAHRGRGLPIKAMDEGCTGPKRPVRAGSSCALERCLVCPCAGREQGHARVWHHQHHCFFCRSRNCCCPKNGCVRAGRCCTRARFLCLTFGKKKPETFSGLRMQTGPSRMFPPLYNRRVARKERVNILATGTGSNSADSPAWCLCSNWRMHIPAGGPELGDWERNVCKPPSRMPRAPSAPCTHGRARTVRPLRGGDHASKRPRRH